MKVYPFKIPKPIHENLFVQIDKGAIFYDKLHQHEEIQISYILKGRGKLIVADSIHQYEDGDVFVIGSKSPHVFQSIERKENASHMISLFFTEKAFGDLFEGIQELEQISRFFYKSNVGLKLLSKKKPIQKIMLKLVKANKLNKFILFLKLLKNLCESETEVLTQFIYQKKISNNEGQRMQAIFDYVMNNFQNDITLETVSELAFMTPNAFCRFFKQRTNKTFFQFLIELRIEHACQLLAKNEDLSIAQISGKSGFKSISNFNRKFKTLKGMTPSTYFNKMNDGMVYSKN
tara:strand:+ start:11611 stop:12480 length:870 start_codon:yes stop_codon:yes gene_type:complete